MRVECDRQADASCIKLKDAESAMPREVEDNFIIDHTSGKMVGIELLFVSDYLSPGDVESFTVANLGAGS